MKSEKNPMSRRKFLAGLLAASAAPHFIPRRVLGGQAAPSRKVRLGHIGTGGQGTALLRNFLTVESAVSAAICDPYRERRERPGRRHADQHARRRRGNQPVMKAGPDPGCQQQKQHQGQPGVFGFFPLHQIIPRVVCRLSVDTVPRFHYLYHNHY